MSQAPTITLSALTATAPPPELSMVLAHSSMLCEGIRELRLRCQSGGSLPSFVPGSHIGVTWAPGRQNSYSLTGPSLDPDYYSISVRLDPSGAGGSRWVHSLLDGAPVTVSRPRSAFAPIANARHHLLVAGGIGVTPILSHVRAAVLWNRSFEVVYSHRPGYGAHADALAELCGERLRVVETPGEFWDYMHPTLRRQPLGTHMYTCGPSVMIDAVAEAARLAGWPSGRVHSEPFSSTVTTTGKAFAAKLGRSGAMVSVPSEGTLLEALLEKGIAVPNLCRQGVCGECRLTVRSGAVDHRDLYLTEREKASGESMMPCVSRAVGDLLELDL